MKTKAEKCRAWREANPDKVRDYQKTHRAQCNAHTARWAKANPAKIRASQRIYVERNHHKWLCRKRTELALRQGRITRQPCEVCGESKAQSHHDNYDRPLDVRWLCLKHHQDWHKQIEPE